PVVRAERVLSKGLLFCRLDEPSGPKHRRVALTSKAIINGLLYGPDDTRASKLVLHESGKSNRMERWMAADILDDAKTLAEARAFIASSAIPQLMLTAGTVGCP